MPDAAVDDTTTEKDRKIGKAGSDPIISPENRQLTEFAIVWDLVHSNFVRIDNVGLPMLEGFREHHLIFLRTRYVLVFKPRVNVFLLVNFQFFFLFS